MRIIEFIGAPAMGKSTILREAMKLRKHDDNWLTSKEARIRIATGIKYRRFGLSRLIQICLKLSIIDRFNDTMASIILAAYEKDIFQYMLKKCNSIASILFNATAADDTLSPVQKLKQNSHHYDKLFKDIVTLEYFKIKELIVYDGGIIHNTPAFASKETFIEFLDNHDFNDFNIIPAGVIYCTMEENQHLLRSRQRINHKNGTFLEVVLDDGELKTFCSSQRKSAENKVKVLRRYNIPVLEIDMSKSIEENAKSVYEFLSNFH